MRRALRGGLPLEPAVGSAGAAAPKPAMAATGSSPARRARSWSPPTSSGRSAQAAPHEQRADAGRAAELVGGHGQQVGAELVEGDGVVAGGLGGVDVDEHARARGTPPPPRRPAGGCRPRGCPTARARATVSGRTAASELVGVDPPEAVDADDRDLAVGLGGEPHRRVLDGGQHLVAAALGRPPARRRDGLGGPAGEHDRARPGPEQRGDLLPGRLHGHPGLEPLGVDPARDRPGRPQPLASPPPRASGRSGEVDAWSR